MCVVVAIAPIFTVGFLAACSSSSAAKFAGFIDVSVAVTAAAPATRAVGVVLFVGQGCLVVCSRGGVVNVVTNREENGGGLFEYDLAFSSDVNDST